MLQIQTNSSMVIFFQFTQLYFFSFHNYNEMTLLHVSINCQIFEPPESPTTITDLYVLTKNNECKYLPKTTFMMMLD